MWLYRDVNLTNLNNGTRMMHEQILQINMKIKILNVSKRMRRRKWEIYFTIISLDIRRDLISILISSKLKILEDMH